MVSRRSRTRRQIPPEMDGFERRRPQTALGRNSPAVSFSPASVRAGLAHLRAADPALRAIIERVGPFRLELERDHLQMLVRSILWQQISFYAARAIHERLRQELGKGKLTPEKLLGLSPEQFRKAGVSSPKAGYLLDLGRKISSGEIRLARLAKLSDEEIVAELTRVRGI